MKSFVEKKSVLIGFYFLLMMIIPGFIPIASGQSVPFTISSPQKEYLIGEHATLYIELEADRLINVRWPLVPDTLAGGLHVLRREPKDSMQTPEGMLRHTQSIIVSAFDSGFYRIKNITAELLYPGQTIPDSIIATPFEIHFVLPTDQPDEPLRDIAGPMSIPLGVFDVILWFVYLLLVLLTIYLIYRVYKRLRRKRPIAALSPARMGTKAPWEVALDALRALQQSDVLWVKGVKRYYIELTEILREYIRDGLLVNAPELTTAQTLSALKGNPAVAPESLARLSEILRVGDLVKFATYRPTAAVNHDLLEKGFAFVHETAPAHMPEQMTTEKL